MEEVQANRYHHCLGSFVLTVMIPHWRSMRIDLRAVITWVGLESRVAEPHAFQFFCTHQLDVEKFSLLKSGIQHIRPITT